MHLHYNLLLAKQTPSSKSHKIELSNFKIPCHTLSSSPFLCLTMANPSLECPLPLRVEEMLKTICSEQNQPPPNTGARRELASLGEGESLKLLEKIRHCKIRSFSAFIHFMAKKYRENVDGQGIDFSPPVYQKLGSPCSRAASPVSICSSSRGSNCVSSPGIGSYSSETTSKSRRSVTSFISGLLGSIWSIFFRCSKQNRLSPQLLVLEELEFKRAFLVLSYIGGRKLEDVTSPAELKILVAMNRTLGMGAFEHLVWEKFGHQFCHAKDRMKYRDWESAGKHCYYHCHVDMEGNYAFKGPFVSTKGTLLQKTVQDDNVLVVKLIDKQTRNASLSMNSRDSYAAMAKIVQEGIYLGRRCYRFFTFKDGGKAEKKKDPICSSIKCYFVNMEAFRQSYGSYMNSMRQARSIFMHLDTLPSLAKYTARLELVLSKTTTLPINLNGEDVRIHVINDIMCQHDDGSIVKGEDGQPLIHTDGTGFISEDLARLCPPSSLKGDFLNEHYSEPLLLQFRLFHEGYAVKGTVLLNKKLERKTIQVRPSMIKVYKDQECPVPSPVNSFEVVAISDRPKKSYLSKYLIALLNYGGVPRNFFMDILKDALADVQISMINRHTALQVALLHGDMDDDSTVARMILSKIPLDEPYIQTRLCVLANQQAKSLREGKLPIDESFYLMGTADPTGALNEGEVCIIHENGQISGKVLVYRNPGIHFGDIRVLTAIHIEGLEDIIGCSKYGILFPTKGPRSLTDMMAGGDLDGDMYWVSRHPILLKYFKQSHPWTCMNHYSSKSSEKKPIELSDEELERELFSHFLTARFHRSKAMGTASNSWLAHMDQMLTNEHTKERNCLKEKLLKLVDIYYEALDAPKTGGEVRVPRELIPETYPHFMEMTKSPSYESKSVLGEIYDQAQEFNLNTPAIPVWKLPPLDVEVPYRNLKTWQRHYEAYRAEMTAALSTDDVEAKRASADKVIEKYKQILYEASELEKSPRAWEEISIDSLAIFRVSYDYAIKVQDAKKCGFAWKVAGEALMKIFIKSQNEKPLVCVPSVMRELFVRNNTHEHIHML